MAMTTIKLNSATKALLDEYREHPAESYDLIVRKVVSIVKAVRKEPQLSKRTVEQIDAARKRIAAGEYYTEEELKKLLGVRHA